MKKSNFKKKFKINEKEKKNTHLEKIFAKDLSNKGLLSKIHEELKIQQRRDTKKTSGKTGKLSTTILNTSVKRQDLSK